MPLLVNVSAKIITPATNVKIVLQNITTLQTAAILVIVMKMVLWIKIAMPMENVHAKKMSLEINVMKLLKAIMTSLILKNVIAMLKVLRDLVAMKKAGAHVAVTLKETNVTSVIQNIMDSQPVMLACVMNMGQ